MWAFIVKRLFSSEKQNNHNTLMTNMIYCLSSGASRKCWQTYTLVPYLHFWKHSAQNCCRTPTALRSQRASGAYWSIPFLNPWVHCKMHDVQIVSFKCWQLFRHPPHNHSTIYWFNATCVGPQRTYLAPFSETLNAFRLNNHMLADSRIARAWVSAPHQR